jgi:isoleucyl-tRNA synthetase
VDAAGRFFQAEGAQGALPESLLGKSVWEANPLVIGLLKHNGALLAETSIEHSYPHCWRCHRPTIFRATEQWFIGMDRNNLRQRALEAIRQVQWNPAWGQERISNMIATRPDWCISRQRFWGVPLIVLHCERCQAPLADRLILDGIVQQIGRHSADVWYERTAAELAPAAKCASCGGTSFRKGTDILDVWFDSGVSHLAVLTPANALPWPADMYLEGGDQYRGWFHSSLLVGVALRGSAPYRGTATNGWVLDGEGKALSKSQGAEAVDKITHKYGADILRLWVASIDFTEDVRLSDTILERLVEAYRKLRNTFRFALGNLWDFHPEKDSVPDAQMLDIDRWILSRAAALIRRCRQWYDALEFHKVYRAVYDFATVELSALYFDILKDRLYTAAPAGRARRSGQTALYRVHYALTRLVAPLVAFTAEEIWRHTPKPGGAPSSVHLAALPQPDELGPGLPAATLARWDRLMEVREVVLKALEEARQAKRIGKSLEARVRLRGYRDLESELPAVFIVSQVVLEPGAEVEAVIEPADGSRCERCWKYSTLVGRDLAFPTACEACAETLRETPG